MLAGTALKTVPASCKNVTMRETERGVMKLSLIYIILFLQINYIECNFSAKRVGKQKKKHSTRLMNPAGNEQHP